MAHTRLAEFIELLAPPSAENIASIHSLFENKRLKKGEIILKAGDHCSSFYFVESGYLRTFYTKEDDEININFHLEGSITSDHKNAKLGRPSEFTIAAGQPSEIWILDRKRLEDLS